MIANTVRRDLVAVDEAAVVADYEAGTAVDAICQRHDIAHSIAKVGVRLTQPGLRSLAHLDPAIAAEVRRRVAEVLGRG